MIPKYTPYCNLSTEEVVVYNLFASFWLVDPWFLGWYFYSHANSPVGACHNSVTRRDRYIHRGVSWIQYRSRTFYPIRMSKVLRSATLRLRTEAFRSLQSIQEESVLHIGEPCPHHRPSECSPTFESIRKQKIGKIGWNLQEKGSKSLLTNLDYHCRLPTVGEHQALLSCRHECSGDVSCSHWWYYSCPFPGNMPTCLLQEPLKWQFWGVQLQKGTSQLLQARGIPEEGLSVACIWSWLHSFHCRQGCAAV